MGFYIEVPETRDKATQLEQLFDAVRVSRADAAEVIEDDIAVICVIHNPFSFEAALYCYNYAEFLRACDPRDARARTWLLMDRALAESLTFYPSSDGHEPE